MDKITVDNIINLYHSLTYDDTVEIKRQLVKLYCIRFSKYNPDINFIINASDKNHLIQHLCSLKKYATYGGKNKIYQLIIRNNKYISATMVKLYHYYDTCTQNTCILCKILDTHTNKKILDPLLVKANLGIFCRQCSNGEIIKIISKNNICFICQTSDCTHIMNKSILVDRDCLSTNDLYRFYINKKIIRPLILDRVTDLYFIPDNHKFAVEPLINKLTVSTFLNVFNQFSLQDQNKIIKKTVGSIYFIDNRYLIRAKTKKSLVKQILKIYDTSIQNYSHPIFRSFNINRKIFSRKYGRNPILYHILANYMSIFHTVLPSTTKKPGHYIVITIPKNVHTKIVAFVHLFLVLKLKNIRSGI